MNQLVLNCKNCGHKQTISDVSKQVCQNCGSILDYQPSKVVYCRCPNCGHIQPRGDVICSLERCPKCESPMING